MTTEPTTEAPVRTAARPGPVKTSRVPKASTLLASQLRDHIVRNRLPVGSALPNEAELIETSELSRGTVREALRLLEAEGLIRIRRGPHGGVEAARPNIDHVTRSLSVLLALSDARLRDLFEFRRLLEPVAARYAAENATDEQRAELQQAAIGSPEQPIDFHVALADACANEFLRLTLQVAMEIADWQTSTELLGEVDLARARELHGRIADAIADGDGDRAESAMHKHLDDYERVMEKHARMDAQLLRATEEI